MTRLPIGGMPKNPPGAAAAASGAPAPAAAGNGDALLASRTAGDSPQDCGTDSSPTVADLPTLAETEPAPVSGELTRLPSPASAGETSLAAAAAPGGFFGIPPIGSLVNAPRGEQTRVGKGSDQKVVPAMPGEAVAAERTAGQPAKAQPARRHVASALTEAERDELDKLRKDIADAASERDAAARLIKEAML
ncbi:hypothetical protein A5647_09715 [Mycobacterium sp. 1100029.7]|nr:hypothetical protein A5647_09715 [Mycobacterium sp. 1100029.7]